MNKRVQLIISCIIGLFGMTLLIIFDQFTKSLAVTHLYQKEPIVLIEGVFELFYLENRGAAFGLFQDRSWFFVIMSMVILLVIAYCYVKFPVHRKYRPLRILGILVGAGAVGNMIDRIANGYVIDFFYFSLIDFPVFNVADCYLVVSLIVLMLLIFFYYKEHDFDCLTRKTTVHVDEEFKDGIN